MTWTFSTGHRTENKCWAQANEKEDSRSHAQVRPLFTLHKLISYLFSIQKISKREITIYSIYVFTWYAVPSLIIGYVPVSHFLLGFGRTKSESFWFLFPILIIVKWTRCQRTWRGCDSYSAQPTNHLKWREHDGYWYSSPTKVSKGRSNYLNIYDLGVGVSYAHRYAIVVTM